MTRTTARWSTGKVAFTGLPGRSASAARPGRAAEISRARPGGGGGEHLPRPGGAAGIRQTRVMERSSRQACRCLTIRISLHHRVPSSPSQVPAGGAGHAAGATSAAPETWRNSVVSVIGWNSLAMWSGSGSVIGDGKWVVTCFHVAARKLANDRPLVPSRLMVISPWTGESVEARVVKTNASTDLALLRLDGPALPALALAAEDALGPGDARRPSPRARPALRLPPSGIGSGAFDAPRPLRRAPKRQLRITHPARHRQHVRQRAWPTVRTKLRSQQRPQSFSCCASLRTTLRGELRLLHFRPCKPRTWQLCGSLYIGHNTRRA